jgi:hypothetical protein
MDKEADNEKFIRITTEGERLLPRDIKKYIGCVSSYDTKNGKRWRSQFHNNYKYLKGMVHKTEDDAVAFIKEVNIKENLPIKNIVYKHDDEYYCVLGLRNQIMKFSIEDMDLVESHTWYSHYCSCVGAFYAQTKLKGVMKSYPQLLFPEMRPGETGDHISRNTLDNTRSNLRIASKREQRKNQRISSRNKSGIKGVYRYKRGWKAAWSDINGKQHKRSFSDKKHGGSENSKKMAIIARENGETGRL